MPPSKLSPEAQSRADVLSNWLGQQQVDYAQPVQLQGILLNLAAEVQKLNRDKDTSNGTRRVIDSILNAISLFGMGGAAAAQLGIDDLNHVAMSLVAKLDQQSYLLLADLTALSDRIQDVRQKLQVVANPQAQGTSQNVNNLANNAPTAPELQALQDIETKLENLVEKGKQVGSAIDIAIISVSVRTPYVFSYTERGQTKNQTYPTLYDLAAEVIGYENNADFKKLVQVAGTRTPSLLADPFIDSAKKWGDQIEKLKNEAVEKVGLIFQADQLALDIAAARAALYGPTIKFDGSLNLLAQVTALEAAIAAIKIASFPAGAELRDAELNWSEPLLKQAKLSEWIRTLGTTAPDLKKLLDEVTAYPTGWTGTLTDHDKHLEALIFAAEAAKNSLNSDQTEYVEKNITTAATRLQEKIARDLSLDSNRLSDPEYQYERKKDELKQLSDWDLVEASLSQGSKVHIEEHGGIDLSRPIEKAMYDVLSERIFTDPERKRTEPGYRSTDANGDENFDKWLLARGRMSLRAFKRKFVDSGAARSNVGLWKTEAPQSASELTMFGFLMNRGPLMLETYHHPVVGPFLTELMERMLAQGSLRKGVIAVRDPADNRYYAKRLRPTDPQPSQADIDSGRVLLPDPEFNYDKMHQPSNGISKYLTGKVEELIIKLQPQFNLDAFYLSTIKEMAISIFCDFNYVDVISSSAQERTQTPISPRTTLVSSIEAIQNLASNVAHTLLRYRAERKSQNWFAPMIDFASRFDAIGPHVGDSDDEHHKDIHLLQEVIHKITTFYSIHFESSVLNRVGTPEKLGKVKMAALGHSQGVPNMHETLMIKSPREKVDRDEVTVLYDYDKYIMTLSMWSKFLDAVIEGMPEKMTVEDVEKSSDNKGIIDTLITKILAVAKLTPGTHYDMVPIMLYTVSQRILARFVDHRDRMQVLSYMKRRFTEACNKGQGLDAFAPQMKPFLKMFGVGTLDAEDRAALTYDGYHKDFAPVKDYDQRNRVHEYLVAEWNEKHPGVPAPKVVNLRRPVWIDWGMYKLATGDLTKAAEEFYHQLEHLSPEAPADRVGIKDDAKK